MNQVEQDDSKTGSLTKLRRGFQVLYSVAFVVLFVGVGTAPGNWGLPFGVMFATFTVYWAFREEIEQRLTAPQEWGVFALAVSTVLLSIVVESRELTDEALMGFGGTVIVTALFGYRAIKRR